VTKTSNIFLSIHEDSLLPKIRSVEDAKRWEA
jgi:hypothetical protein